MLGGDSLLDKKKRVEELRLLLYEAIDKCEENIRICRISEELDEQLLKAYLQESSSQ